MKASTCEEVEFNRFFGVLHSLKLSWKWKKAPWTLSHISNLIKPYQTCRLFTSMLISGTTTFLLQLGAAGWPDGADPETDRLGHVLGEDGSRPPHDI